MSPWMDFLTDHLWFLFVYSIPLSVILSMTFVFLSLKSDHFTDKTDRDFQNEDDKDKI